MNLDDWNNKINDMGRTIRNKIIIFLVNIINKMINL